MTLKNILTLILLAVGLFLISCKEKQKNSNENPTEQKVTINTDFLIGSWIDQSKSLLHFTMFADGTAKSDNMATLVYQK